MKIIRKSEKEKTKRKSFSRVHSSLHCVSTPYLLDCRHSSGSEAPPEGSTPVKFIRAAAADGADKKLLRIG